MVKYLAKFERWSFGVHYLHLKNVGSILLIIQHEATPLFLLMFDIKHKKHLFWINTFQIARKNLRGDADITPLRVITRRREKYYTGLSLDILKRESWTHVGRTANIIIKDVIHIFASISKIMRILLMGRRNRERWLHQTIFKSWQVCCSNPPGGHRTRRGRHCSEMI